LLFVAVLFSFLALVTQYRSGTAHPPLTRRSMRADDETPSALASI
jgi:hypothetical protein